MVKKLFGWLFIVAALMLSLLAVTKILSILKGVFEFLKIFSGKLDAADAGDAIGEVLYWVLHVVIIISLWRYGLRWTAKSSNKSQTLDDKPAADWRRK